MKSGNIFLKKLFILTFIFLSATFLFAQNSEKQVLIPHSVFVGDNAILTISFLSKADLSSETPVSIQNFERKLNEKEYTITNISLSKNPKKQNDQFSYTLSIQFIPWITGKIKFPPLHLENDFVIIPSEINIDSIFTGAKRERKFIGAKGPLLVPGTTYRILFKLILSSIILIVLITAFFKWKKINLFYKNLKLKLLYLKNKKKTLNALNKLKNSSLSHKEIACNFQIIFRKYLSVRFDYPFQNCSTSEIWLGFSKIFQGLLSEKKEEAVEDLTGLFTRTDFIRYSKDGFFNNNEINELIQKASDIINTLESQEEE